MKLLGEGKKVDKRGCRNARRKNVEELKRSNHELRHFEEAIMGAAYSVDLRRKVVQACERGTALQAQLACFFGVSQAFVEKLLRLYRRTGAPGTRPQARRPSRIARCGSL